MAAMDTSNPGDYRLHHYQLLLAQQQPLAGNYSVKLGSRAFDVLATLVERRGRVVPQFDLMDLMWPRPVLEQKPTLGDSMPQSELAFKDGCLLCAASGDAEPIPTQGDL
jgi:DNA-binding response OmpR family regulator